MPHWFLSKRRIITATSASLVHVSTAISIAVTGDTVLVPATVSPESWTGGVSVSEGITIRGAGAGRIIAVCLDTLSIGTGSKSLTLISSRNDETLTYLDSIISNGLTLRIHEFGFKDNFMQGTVTSYSSGALVMNITSSGGTIGTSGPANTANSNGKRWIIETMPSTVIQNNYSGTLFFLTENTVASINISGIRITQGSGANKDFQLTRNSGGKPILIHDMYCEHTGGDGCVIDGNTSRGIVWNSSFICSPAGQSNSQGLRTKDDNNLSMPTSWTTTSTFGMNDTDGTNNLYFEGNDIHGFLQGFTDLDDNSRTVFRYNFLNNSGNGTHAADTSNIGLRHFEWYNNRGIHQGYSDGSTANQTNWIFIRGGSWIIHSNILDAIAGGNDYGARPDFTLTVMNLDRNGGGHACWGEGTSGGLRWPAPRQIGMGYVTGLGTCTANQRGCTGTGCSDSTHFSGSTDAFTYVGDSEPCYLWNNKRTQGGSFVALDIGIASGLGECTSPDSQSNYLVDGRDFFNSTTTPKSGYTPYTYPHPLTV